LLIYAQNVAIVTYFIVIERIYDVQIR